MLSVVDNSACCSRPSDDGLAAGASDWLEKDPGLYLLR